MFLAMLNFRNTLYVNFDSPSVHVIQRYYEWETLISRNAINVTSMMNALTWKSLLKQRLRCTRQLQLFQLGIYL